MARKKRLEQSVLHSLLNLIFQKERIAGINTHGMQLAALGQIIDVLTGTP